MEREVVPDLGGVVARVKQQVNRLPFVGHGGVADHRVVADVGLGDPVSESIKAEVRPDLPQREGVEALVPPQGDTVQLAKVLYTHHK